MYPDQVQKIRQAQEGASTFSTATAYRREQAELHIATRYRFRDITPSERARIEFWVLHGGRRPWGI